MKSLLIITTLLIGLALNAKDFTTIPPDSNANILQKGVGGILVTEGRALLNEGNTRGALLKFREAINKDKKNAIAHYFMGECQFKLKKYENALKKAEDAIKIKADVYDESHYLVARCHHALGNFDDAIKNYKTCQAVLAKKKERLKTLRIEEYIQQCEYSKKLKAANKNVVKATKLEGEINSNYPQYGFIWADSIAYFTSRRADTKGGRVNPADNIYFEDIYGATYNKSTKQYDQISNELGNGKINTKTFESFSFITKDGMFALLTMNNEMAEDKPKYKTGSSDIFYSKKNKRGTWASPRPYGKNINTTYYEGNAVLTADGETMYFVSERKGGKGMSDIWMAEKAGKDWNKPVNLGDSINTKYKETTPWITPDGKYLFFSSEGHDQNMGGYDIFVSKKGQEGFEKAINVGIHINSETDDFYFRMIPGGKKGHISRVLVENGAGVYKILEVDLENFDVKEITSKK